MMANYRVHSKWFAVQVAMAIAASALWAAPQQPKVTTPQSLRLFVFDCGMLHFMNADAYSLKKEEVAQFDMSVPCFLVAHPRGTMIWDAGIITDTDFNPGSGTVSAGIATSEAPLFPQFSAAD